MYFSCTMKSSLRSSDRKLTKQSKYDDHRTSERFLLQSIVGMKLEITTNMDELSPLKFKLTLEIIQ